MNKYEIRYIRALNQFFEEMIYDEEQFNNILVTIYNNKELKQLVNRLTDKEDNEDAYCEFILQVAEIKDKQKLIDIFEKNNREFHWYCIRIITNMFKSKTSDYFRKYRRPKQQKDDNSEKIMNIINDIGNFNDVLLGFIGKEIEDKLSEDVNYDEVITNQQIMNEVKWFVKNKLNWYEQELYKMYYDENLSHYEISKITKIPATSIGLTIRTIKKNLMNHLTNKKIFK